MQEELLKIKQEALDALKKCESLEALNNFRLHYLGKKGALTQVLRNMGKLTAEERPLMGQFANEVRDTLEKEISFQNAKLEELALEKQIINEDLDVTLPGVRMDVGHPHPLSKVIEMMEDIFLNMGFQVAEGYEVETDYYNFEAMNLPKNHPARDMQDSFYITDEILLRTHTSPTQTRVMESMTPQLPVKVIIPGKVYRRDDDATHSPMFHQVEGLVVDKNIRFSDLKGILLTFVRKFYGENQKIRLRPSYFPFTEPSAEVDILCVMCGGSGCRTCKNTGWIEVLGAGMVHPNVLKMGGYNPEEVTGFAFGMGVERLAMLKYGVDDLRLFFENDWRFIEQF